MPEIITALFILNNPYNLYNFVATALSSQLTVRKLIIIFSPFAVGFSPIFTGKRVFSQVQKNYRTKSFQFLQANCSLQMAILRLKNKVVEFLRLSEAGGFRSPERIEGIAEGVKSPVERNWKNRPASLARSFCFSCRYKRRKSKIIN